MAKNLTVSSTSRPRRRRRNRRTPSGGASATATRPSAATRTSDATARTSAATAPKPQPDELFLARPTPEITGELALKLAIVLGLSPLNRPPTCHGYANECSCEECAARSRHLSHRTAEVRQPWDASG
jgi:hypothetical protein